MPFAAERRAAESAARAAADFIRPHAGGLDAADLRSKGVHDLVTFVDEGSQRIVVDALGAAFPDDRVLAEEGADADLDLDRGRVWIVDPLDGTTNFAHGVPPYAVSIGLRVDGVGAVGVVLDVSSGELFSAARGAGLEVDGQRGTVSATDRLDDALVATGFPFRDYRYLDGYLAAAQAVMRSARGLRRHGAAAVDLAWTAAGRFDGFFEAGLAPWDLAAGVVLEAAAGGVVTGLWDGADPVATGGVLAAAPGVADALGRAVAPLGAAYRRATNGG
ncbi:inositol monophosphatase family protein [Rubrivirga sp.]|uniref:inositol monophosphatase family protein n=1 Tax=Rubrivirga sp. TaxID=1885344 RepID=UPI003B53027D